METPWSFAESNIDGHTWTSDQAADPDGTNLDSVLQSIDSDCDLADGDEVEVLLSMVVAGECKHSDSEGPQIANI
jgi:hypothetical protein